ncbi:Asp23/Gls24 family envelope stress response protein [Streptomyces sp. NPDC048507]|uniref:Asp23/Gls24 family envelope stress response protein n=1 Tax=Streptomyces sp. NPDC048507 TaxID=3365560 RepID=UPI00370FD6AC
MAMNTPDPHEAAQDDGCELLACGRDLAAVWEQTGPPDADPHTRGCPSCRRARAELESLRAAALHPHEARTAEAVDTSALVRRVMDVVRLELRPGRNLPLGEPGEDCWIFESVAARTLRAAAEEVPGVRAGSCRITVPGSRPGSARGPVSVHLDVTAEYGRDLRTTSLAVRDSAARAARDRLGLTVAALDVTVTDLHDRPDEPQEAAP